MWKATIAEALKKEFSEAEHKRFIQVIRLILAIVGAATLGIGCWMVYPPAGLIVVGLLMIIAASRGRIRR
ncbi:MAG: hypothetical protein MI923_21450 [Phycisphaerales bacterium]|nr:hypothetical protein [Phycisphaerales bacterium]